MKIVSDNPAIEKSLRSIEKTICENDGYIDPELVIRCEDGGLSVEKDAPQGGKHMIAMAADLLLPVEKMGITVKGDEILANPEKDALSDVQRKLTDDMFEVYNLTNKIGIHKATHPWIMYKAAPQYVDMIFKARTLNDRQRQIVDFIHNGPDEGAEFNDMVCDTYLHSRTLGHKAKPKDGAADAEAAVTPSLMPIIDFYNHHYMGAPYGFEDMETAGATPGKREFLCMRDERPHMAGNECFAFYTQMDAIDTLFSYGFPDPDVPIVRSVPTEIEIPKAGKIIFNAYVSNFKKGKLHKNVAGLRPFIPNTLRKEDGLLEVTHILVPCGGTAPHALRRVLRMMIANLALRALTADEIWQSVLEAEILTANIDFYSDLVSKLEDDKSNPGTQTPAGRCRDTALTAARLQLNKLYKYQYTERQDSAGAQNESPATPQAVAAE